MSDATDRRPRPTYPVEVVGKWKPSIPQRLRGWLLGAPSRLSYLIDSDATRSTGEDAFSSGEGGTWAWYPASGTFAPRPLGRWWLISGSGTAAYGSVHRSSDRIRFVPNSFWAARGVSDWEREVLHEDVDGLWHRLVLADGVTVLRSRRFHRSR